MSTKPPRQSSASDEFKLSPPDNLAVVDWLMQFDNHPRLLPIWPSASQMTLVVVAVPVRNGPQLAESTAWVLVDPTKVDEYVALSSAPLCVCVSLFFTVAKARVSPHCAGLAADAGPVL